MKAKIVLLVAVLAIVTGAAGWFAKTKLHWQLADADGNKILYYTCPMHADVHADKPGKCPECGMNLVPVYAKASIVAADDGKKILYYQSAMHPWIKSDKPGKCPICGMNLVPVYTGENNSSAMANVVVLNSNSISAINVQTETVQRRPIVHSLDVAGEIEMDVHPTHFVFTAYEQDFAWLDVGQKVEVTIPSAPGKIYEAKITRVDSRFRDSRGDLTHGIQVRATLSESLVQVNGIKRVRPFDGFYAEGRVIANTREVLAAPRSAVLSAGHAPIVYVDHGNGNYQKVSVKPGRVGDEFYEILDGLKEGDKVVTNGNLLIDSEAQLATGE